MGITFECAHVDPAYHQSCRLHKVDPGSGRTDSPARGLWFNNGHDPLIDSELANSYVGWIQLRPDPLAR